MKQFLKNIWSVLISMKLMVALIVLYAATIATGTFIENDYGRDTAWALIYAAGWFELLQLILGINLVANIVRFKLYKRKKLPAFIFHVAFIVIMLGAAITRYFGYEGVMSIREGGSENRMISSDAFLQVKAQNGKEAVSTERKIIMSALGGNDFTESLEIGGKELEVSFKKFVPKAARTAVEDPNGAPIIAFVIPTPSGPEKYFLQQGGHVDPGPIEICFDKEPSGTKPYIKIFMEGEAFKFSSNAEIGWFRMADQQQGMYEADTVQEFNARRLYMINGVQVATKAVLAKGKKTVVSEEEYKESMKMQIKMQSLSALVVDVTYDGETKEVALMGKGSRFRGFAENFSIKGIDVSLEWGSKILELPFSIFLRDFAMDKYAGSMSPSSYESHVTVVDEASGVNMPYVIYMNNVLDYGGYLFFQSSYDKDERGTILSVNHDPGKWPTYLGYTLLTIGMLLNFLNPNGRFGKLARTKYEHNKGKVATFLAALSALLLLNEPVHAYANQAANDPHAGHNHMDISKVIDLAKTIDADVSEAFGTLMVQGSGGRIKPMDTVSINFMNKIYGKSSLMGLSHNQVVLGMASRPKLWQQIAMIKVGHPEVKKLFGVPKEKKHLAYADAFNRYGQYKIAQQVQDAIRKRPAERNKFDKALIKVDEKLNVAYMVYSGDFMRFFPMVGDPNNTWYPPSEALKSFPQAENMQVRTMLNSVTMGLNNGYVNGDWSQAYEGFEQIKANQLQKSAAIVPASGVVEMELLYNKLNVFERLYPIYLLSGLVLLLLIFIRLTKPSLDLSKVTKIVLGILVLGFAAHTLALGMRWYVSGHAPWSDGYESMIYIGWTIVLAGIMFARQSEFAVASTGVLAGLTLFVAHLSWLDPQITNLVPVLKSYWLTIHVSVITASYGFLGLSMLLGFICLILFIMMGQKRSDATKEQITISIKEATRISEMSMIIGLSLVTIGNFLGGVWANESWGRYWGWDPKETWALVTILVYAAVVHMRFIPGGRAIYAYSVASVLAYSSVIMTYFGVNYYLSGLHSYASGDPVPVPVWVYYAVAVVFAVILLAYRNVRHMPSKLTVT